ncbi:MAG TPA: helix-turn-helix domain-containing protein [Chloroflexota bacterium]|nr:helix-turn-helix domain-containing protein [Chloroflexota bacterium]
MTNDEFRAARTRASLTVRAAAAQLEVAPVTIWRWESGAFPIPTDAAEMIARLASGGPAHPTAYALGQVAGICAWVLDDDAVWPNFPTSPEHWLGPLMQRVLLPAYTVRRQQADHELTAIMQRVSAANLPDTLSDEEQSQLWLGYYHWRADWRVREKD